MIPVQSFRVSLYAMLGLAILAVGVAGGDLLPEIPYMTMFSLVLLGAAFRIEGRWELSLRHANLVGFILVALLGLWALYQTIRPATGLMDNLPWPASALPYMAPVIMILIPAKMFRPKHVGDYWAMQGLGILAMALACAMTSEGLFVLLFGLYALIFTWNLAAFFLFREMGPATAAVTLGRQPRWQEAKFLSLLAVGAIAVAIPLFWITPRGNTSWELGINMRGRASTGISDGPVDLNRVGTVDVVRDKIFSVYITKPNGEPYTQLPLDQRWRTGQLQQYEGGRWSRTQFGGISIVDRAVAPAGGAESNTDWLPSFGPDTVHIKYHLATNNQRNLPMADPVAWQTGVYSPIVSRTATGKFRNWVHHQDGTFDGIVGAEGDARGYLQAWAAPTVVGYGSPMRVDLTLADRLGLARLPRELSRIKNYTDGILQQAVTQNKLHPAALTEIDSVTRGRVRQYHEAIARVLESHLNANPEFQYSLELTRSDRTMDPIEDFLLNTKTGHCQRYATALVMMLRSQGITSQLVLGYRGCEPLSEGWYEVYSSHAHAWVEVLVAAPDAKLPPLIDRNTGTERTGNWLPMRWVTLDPTPGNGEGIAAEAEGFLSQAKERWEAVLRFLVLTYNAESREEAFAMVQDWLQNEGGSYWIVGSIAGLVGGIWLRRRWKAYRATPRSPFPDYLRQLLKVLRQKGIVQQPGQTLREYLQQASGTLTLAPDLVEILQQVPQAYYAERFGARPANDVQHEELRLAVQRFANAVA